MVLLLWPGRSWSRARFWNLVIPDGSTTIFWGDPTSHGFWNLVIPDGSTTAGLDLRAGLAFWNLVIPDGSTTFL